MPPILFVVDRREAGQTLASVLKNRYGVSWAQAKRLVERRHVRISQQIETDVAKRLKAGKTVQLDAGSIELKPADRSTRVPKGKDKVKEPTPASSKKQAVPHDKLRLPEKIEIPSGIDLVYTDDVVAVVNKPAGLTTMRHKEEMEEFGRGKAFLPQTLADVLPTLLGVPNRRVIAVHRIDRDTSGLVVFARNSHAAKSLELQFRKHSVNRRYIALTRGIPKPGRIESQLVRDRGDGRRGSSTDPDAIEPRRAVTRVRILEGLGTFALVECRLETGRTHQIRIHLGEAGTPLCGERVYDRAINQRAIPDTSTAQRPMLHAIELGFIHPETDEPMNWEIAAPTDFLELLAKLRNSTNKSD